MPRSGDYIEAPNQEKIEFLRTKHETGGALSEVRVRFESNSAAPPAHFHPNQDEHFEVVRGAFVVQLNGESRTFSSGDSFDIPRTTVHSMYNARDEHGELIWQTRPALQTGELFDKLWTIKRDAGETRSRWTWLHYIKAFSSHQNEIILVTPPRPIQRILFLLARMA